MTSIETAQDASEAPVSDRRTPLSLLERDKRDKDTVNRVVRTHAHARLDNLGALRLLVKTAVLDLGTGLRLVERNECHGRRGVGVVMDAGDLAGTDMRDGHAEGDSSEGSRRHRGVWVRREKV